VAFANLLETVRLTEDDARRLNDLSSRPEFSDREDAAEGPAAPAAQSFSRGDRPAQLLKRPVVTVEGLLPALLAPMERILELTPWIAALRAANPDVPIPGVAISGPCRTLPVWVRNEMKSVETAIKFAGYLAQQQRSMERLRRDEARAIPTSFDYTTVSGLSREMVEKLGRVRPSTIGQAGRLPGVTPAALSLIQCILEIQARRSA
jgi:tRNA uridine 5-carboxymethylaminomethyl modification enzyme